MLVAQNSLGSVCPVPLTVRGTCGLGEARGMRRLRPGRWSGDSAVVSRRRKQFGRLRARRGDVRTSRPRGGVRRLNSARRSPQTAAKHVHYSLPLPRLKTTLNSRLQDKRLILKKYYSLVELRRNSLERRLLRLGQRAREEARNPTDPGERI